MNKAVLLKKLETMIDEAVRTEMWGKIELTFSRGVPHTIRKEVTESLSSEGKGNPHNANKSQV
jgi:hypothetical protein